MDGEQLESSSIDENSRDAIMINRWEHYITELLESEETNETTLFLE